MIKTNQLFDDMFTAVIFHFGANVAADLKMDVSKAFVVERVCNEAMNLMQIELKRK